MNIFGLKALRRLGVAKMFRLTGSRTVEGGTLRFPVQGRLGWEFVHDAEDWMTSVLVRLRPYFDSCQDHAFLDVGVNVGQTLVKYREAMPNGVYFGFEPNPVCVAYVSELIELNGWANVDIYPVGVSESASLCALNFFSESGTDSSASVIENFRPDESIKKRSHIALFPIESADLQHPIAFMKIDVEGAELEVLRGAKVMLKRDRPLVSTEILPCYEASNTFRIQRQEEIEALMKSLVYQCYRITRSSSASVRLESIEVIGVHGSLADSDYLWIPAEKSNVVLGYVNEPQGS